MKSPWLVLTAKRTTSNDLYQGRKAMSTALVKKSL